MKYNRAVCRYGKTLADTNCKLPEVGARTPKHVGVILVLILYYLHMHLLV